MLAQSAGFRCMQGWRAAEERDYVRQNKFKQHRQCLLMWKEHIVCTVIAINSRNMNDAVSGSASLACMNNKNTLALS